MATLSPFRYPGAKNKLLPILMLDIKPLVQDHDVFIDAFVGGGSVLLEVASQFPTAKLYANDSDYWVYSFWRVVSGEDSIEFEELLDMVAQKPTLDLFYALRSETYQDHVRCAYKAIFFNRTTFSGIFRSGPIGGRNQTSRYTVDCRYNPKALRSKIINCRNILNGRLEISNQNYADYAPLTSGNDPIYIDPPYYLAGDSLYTSKMSDQDHFDLSILLYNRDNWVLSYDDCPEVRELY